MGLEKLVVLSESISGFAEHNRVTRDEPQELYNLKEFLSHATFHDTPYEPHVDHAAGGLHIHFRYH